MSSRSSDETYRFCCPECGFEAPPFDHTREEAEEMRQQFSELGCPGCGSSIETLAIIPSGAAELEWDNIEEHWGITLGEDQHIDSDTAQEADNE